ncbi:CDP-alcohol phosphatidyltransferase family protein [Sneathiella sp.]|uniref:CDP-alcohol phosphatidyltransferase family protein n=1 Tax=Sneathiella sp. TaxID=1964365 RepID=UPI002FE0A081
MLDAALRQVIDPPLNAAGRRIAALGVPANAITLGGFALGLAAVPLLAFDYYLAALALILLNRFGDGLDGAVARQTRLTDFGGYLDIVCDFIFYAGVVFGFALADAGNAVAAAFLVFSFMGTGATFLAHAILAERHGITTDLRGHKSLYYLGGLTEGTETILAFVLMCLLPTHFTTIAVIFGLLCWLTTAARIYAAWITFGRTR